LTVADHDPINIEEVITDFISQQAVDVIVPVSVWLVNRISPQYTYIEEKWMMFDQVHFVHIPVPVLLEAYACHVVTSLYKPDCPAHISQMMKSPFKADFIGAHFENYEKMYATGTWSFPVIRLLLPSDALLLPIRPVYAVKSTST
jgi:hypothetical protein